MSEVSAYPGVRRALTAQQRRIGARGRVVMVGRDIGTVVLPEADLKVYLDASVEEEACPHDLTPTTSTTAALALGDALALASASLTRVRIVGLRKPRSNRLMEVRSRPASRAR